MLTDREIYLGIALPGLVSAALMLIVVWRRWTIALPAVLGIAFMAGYWFLRRPELPPQDGSDWLFWMTLPLMLGGMVFQRLGARWAAMGAIAGVLVFVVLRPITPAIGLATIWKSSAIAALWGTAAAIMLPWAARRIGAAWILGALSSIVGATAVLVLSSNYRAYGVVGMGAATAIAAIALGIGWMARHGDDNGPGSVRGLSVVVVVILAGLLAGGRFYPRTGVSPFHFHVFGVAPLLIALAYFAPGKRDWPRGVLAFVLSSTVVWCIAIPLAIVAKHAAETPDSHVLPRLGRPAPGEESGRPRPLEIESTDASVAVEHLAGEV